MFKEGCTYTNDAFLDVAFIVLKCDNLFDKYRLKIYWINKTYNNLIDTDVIVIMKKDERNYRRI